MKRYDSMVLIPEGDTDVDNDGMGDAIMMRMANVEVCLIVFFGTGGQLTCLSAYSQFMRLYSLEFKVLGQYLS